MSSRLTVAPAIVVVATGCSSSGTEDLDVLYTSTYYSDNKVNTWQARGPAVDEGLICPEAMLRAGHFENEDGTPLTESELGARNDGTEPFTYDSVGEFSCADGSGSFTIRLTTVATNPAAFEVASTWQIQGNEGYEDVTGEGTNDETTFEGQPVVIVGHNSGVLRKG